MKDLKLYIDYDQRLCIVNDQMCYFHRWSTSSQISAYGIVKNTYGIVEYPDGTIHEILPEAIKFCDELTRDLYFRNDHYQANKEKKDESKNNFND